MATCLWEPGLMASPPPAAGGAGERLALARQRWEQGRPYDAMELLRRALAAQPRDVRLLRLLGMVHLTAQEPLAAWLAFSTAVALGDQGARPGQQLAERLLQHDTMVVVEEGGRRLHFQLTGRALLCDFNHLAGRLYEAAELRWLAGRRRRFQTIVDVGAHVGNHAVFFLQTFRPRRLVAVEPSPRAAAVLETNLKRNARLATTVEVCRVGAAAAAGTMYLAPGADVGGVLTALPEGSDEPVAVVRLETLVSDADLVKIDTEGMELEVLAGARPLLERCQPLLMLSLTRNPEAVEAFLAGCGYRVEQRFPYPDHENVFAVPAPEAGG